MSCNSTKSDWILALILTIFVAISILYMAGVE